MDLVCGRCGEPWEMDHVIHEDPEEFERSGGRIRKCPCCPHEPVTGVRKLRADAANALADLLGDDIDGIAAELEDMGIT